MTTGAPRATFPASPAMPQRGIAPVATGGTATSTSRRPRPRRAPCSRARRPDRERRRDDEHGQQVCTRSRATSAAKVSEVSIQRRGSRSFERARGSIVAPRPAGRACFVGCEVRRAGRCPRLAVQRLHRPSSMAGADGEAARIDDEVKARRGVSAGRAMSAYKEQLTTRAPHGSEAINDEQGSAASTPRCSLTRAGVSPPAAALPARLPIIDELTVEVTIVTGHEMPRAAERRDRRSRGRQLRRGFRVPRSIARGWSTAHAYSCVLCENDAVT